MSNFQNVTFQEALDIVESLPEQQQEELVEIIFGNASSNAGEN